MLLIEIPRTLGCHEAAPRLPEIDDKALIKCRLEAQERVLADVDTFQNWLCALCANVPVAQTRLKYIPSNQTSRAMFIQALTVAQLAACLLYPDRDLAGRAASELTIRYLAAKDDYVERIAGELMAQGWAE